MQKEKSLDERYMDLLRAAIVDWSIADARHNTYAIKEILGGRSIDMREPCWMIDFEPLWIGRRAIATFWDRGDWVHEMMISVKDWKEISTAMKRREVQDRGEAEAKRMKKKFEFLEKMEA